MGKKKLAFCHFSSPASFFSFPTFIFVSIFLGATFSSTGIRPRSTKEERGIGAGDAAGEVVAKFVAFFDGDDDDDEISAVAERRGFRDAESLEERVGPPQMYFPRGVIRSLAGNVLSGDWLTTSPETKFLGSARVTLGLFLTGSKYTDCLSS